LYKESFPPLNPSKKLAIIDDFVRDNYAEWVYITDYLSDFVDYEEFKKKDCRVRQILHINSDEFANKLTMHPQNYSAIKTFEGKDFGVVLNNVLCYIKYHL
jgi:hypothetical protein